MGRDHRERKLIPLADSQHQPPNMHQPLNLPAEGLAASGAETNWPLCTCPNSNSQNLCIINCCFIPLSFGVTCYIAICNEALKHSIFHLFIIFIVCFLQPKCKLYKGRDFYLFGLLLCARWSTRT